ncbi:response regulator [Paenibacillus sp. SYP-B4298]|uniref:response regulator n=1 Tax=Paenibacillus sp. SYP-B4298 TaxID=2996034 RepID=UPI0022DD9E09|nr:response regulator [Paenibacillus sp. SYP-B4298]
MIKALIVDDEQHALTLLELFLMQLGGFEIVGKCSNGFEALAQMEDGMPDVLFLDIDMPEMSGMKLAEKVREMDTEVLIVFLTAHEQYALTAFEHSAADYLLKPVELSRLEKTAVKLRKELQRQMVKAKTQLTSLAAASDEKDAVLEVSLLGTLMVGVGEQRVKWRTAKERELLAYLALHGGRPVARDLIIEDLWPEENYSKAKIYLHTCVSLLRKHMKQLGFADVLHYESEKYYLDTVRIAIDVHQFKQGIEQIKLRRTDASAVEIEQVLRLYNGYLLQGQDYVWVKQEAEILDNAAYKLRMRLANLYEEQLEHQLLLDTVDHLLQLHSPYDEEVYRMMMRTYHKLGNNDQVRRAYEQLVFRLEELSVKPSEITKQLYNSILVPNEQDST